MRKLFFVALAGLVLAGCNGGGTATNGGAVSADSVTAAATEEVAEAAKWDTIDWDEKTMPIYVKGEKEYGGKFIPYDSANLKKVMPVASTYKTFASAKGKFAMKYEGYDKGAGASLNYNISNRWAAGFKFDVKGVEKKYNMYGDICGMGFNEEFLKSHEVLEFNGYDTWQEDYRDKVRKDVPETVKQRIKAKYPNRKLVDCMCGGKSKDGKVQVYSAELDRIGKKCLGLRVVIDGDSMYVKEDEAEYDAANYSAWRVDDDGHYNNLEVLAITRGKDGIDLFYDDSAPESTCIGVIVLRGGQMFDKGLFNYYNYVDFVPVIEHEYVDLELASGTLWAVCNVGAEKPEEYGEYYAWGETETKNIYSEENAWLMNMNTEDLKSKYGIDTNGNLWKTRDVAIQKWENGWRMPTKEEMKELIDLPNEDAEVKGVRGRKFIGKNGNSVFFPYAGFRTKGGLKNDGVVGYYWSATTYGDEWCAYSIDIDSEGVNLKYYTRNNGFAVRPVKKKK